MSDQDLARADGGAPVQPEGSSLAPVPQRGRWHRTRIVSYWVFTILVIHEMVSGFLWEDLQIEWVRVMLLHLGYPPYVGFIMGPLKLAGAAAIVAPGFSRLKEWAYAGAFFVYAGAVASHMLVGDGPLRWGVPLLYLLLTVGSWALRPADLRSPRTVHAVKPGLRTWAISVGLFVVILVLSYFTLPKGPPPGY
jgi:hypothetical protein